MVLPSEDVHGRTGDPECNMLIVGPYPPMMTYGIACCCQDL